MQNELLAAASEIRLQLAANSIDQALRAACEGLKRFLNDPRHTIQASPDLPRYNGMVQLGPSEPYVTALEQALESADVDPLTTQYLLDNLRLALGELSVQVGPNDEARINAFKNVLRSQQIVCSLPGQVAQPTPVRRNVTKGVLGIVGALAAAGGVALLASPAGLAALGTAAASSAGTGAVTAGGASVVAVLNVALAHVFGKAADAACSALQQVQEQQPQVVICRCHDK